ncbi:MAG TPA: hypothetical protein DD979_01500 [Gammaproteobacteria bacterium]|nr:hypothetical protein [Gammaproteobacteria bacterium]
MNDTLTVPERPWLGFGLGLRTDHYQTILDEHPDVDWFEIISENYMVPGGKPLHFLDKVRADYPMVMHGVSLSIGSTDPLDRRYLSQLKNLAERVQPQWISDHLCWTGVRGQNMHDLLPLPYTEEAVQHVVDRVQQVQEFLGRRLMLENLSSYVTYHQSEMTEWEFITQISEQADCLILLDVNNVYVSSINHSFEPLDYIRGVPQERVWQIHIAGHTTNESGAIMIDTHDMPVRDEVWDVYADTLREIGPVSTMIERDDNIPPLAELLDELGMARKVAEGVLGPA